ncbi:MAG: sugar ABC transporter substrate-binding protein [Paraglaciecola sp.]|uniref:sugar ABC transporter substrate-binding protein n=1 Tax=Paraglaciecola sp. TaxID=1920173 RepID=UPI0032997F4A
MKFDNRVLFYVSKLFVAISAMTFLALPIYAANERFIMVSHAPDSDPWWNTIKNALKEASSDMGVEVLYRNPASGDLADMARIIEQSIASKPDGLIVSIADYDVLKRPLEKALKKQIPVITINSGTYQQSQQLGALTHIGQPEYTAGYEAGKKAKNAGVTEFLCVNHYITNPSSVERCQGYADGLGVELGNSMLDSSQDPTHIEKKVHAYLRSHSNTNGILALGPTSAIPVIRLLKKIREAGKMHFSTFDLSDEIAEAIETGTIDFAIDQQPYLQGYMPIVMLALYSRYGIIPANDMHSGPAFITKRNLPSVRDLSGTVR